MKIKHFLFVLIAFGFLKGSQVAYAATEQDLQQLKQMLAIMRAEISQLKTNSFAVGSIQQSFLSEADFQKQMGKNWVLCDGRAVLASSWEKLGYGSSIPSCTGRFLRSSGGDAVPLRMAQDQDTALNRIKANATTTLASDMSVKVSGTTADAS